MLDPITGNPITPKTNLKHIFLPDIKWLADGSCKISGLHHDYMGLIEQTRLLNMRKFQMLPNNFYSRRLSYAGGQKTSVLFPQKWTRKEVLQKIIDTIKNESFSWKFNENKKYKAITYIDKVETVICYNPAKKLIDTIYPKFYFHSRIPQGFLSLGMNAMEIKQFVTQDYWKKCTIPLNYSKPKT